MVGQVQEKIPEYSELAQTKLEEQYVAREKQKEEQRIAREKQKFEAAAAHASKREYQEAVNFLNAIPSSSEAYEEAQQKIADYINTSTEYVLEQAVQTVHQGLYNEAIAALKTIPESANSYQKAQEKISEYENNLESLIEKHKNLIPMLNGDRIVAAAFVDQTVHLVSQMERKRSIYNSLGSTYADGEFLVLQLIVRNDGKKARTISASMITIVDSTGCEFSVTSNGMTALQMNGDQTVEFLVTEIQPSLEKFITIVFDVPPGANDLSLKVPSGGWGSSATLPLSLAI